MTSAKQIYIGSRRGPALPYDSEVEYLESTGTQWIDTGYKPSNKTKVMYRCRPVSNGTAVGCLNGRVWKPSFSLTFYSGVSPRWGNNANTSYVQFRWSGVDITVEQDKDCYLNGQLVRSYEDNTFNMQYPLILFDRSETDHDPFEGRLYWVRFYESSVLVRDLIPVRFTNEQGQSEGAMYDRLGTGGMNPDGSARTDGLYRNQGTGAFGFGTDIAGGGV